MEKLLAQPLVHFLCLGTVLFALYQWQGSAGNADNEQITVSREKLLTFLQYRSKAFNRELFASKLDAMSDDERQTLIDDWVREEVLYREAKALELDRDDYVIKRRMIQKLEFITQGFIESANQIERDDVAAYFAEHQSDYFVAPYTTFTHVYFNTEKHGKSVAEKRAREMREQLNKQNVTFSAAIQYGDRFLYNTNYVERTPDYVASHFGAPMADAIFAVTSDDAQWQGPFESSYGYHLVLVATNQKGRVPDLEELYEQVKADTQQALIRQKTTEAIDDIVSRYKVAPYQMGGEDSRS